MTQMQKRKKYTIEEFFLQDQQKLEMEMEIFTFCVITFEPIKF